MTARKFRFQKLSLKIPMWLRILCTILMLSIFFTALGSISEFLVPTIFLLLLIVFPGKDAGSPRLLKLAPWLWGLGLVASCIILVADYFGMAVLPPEARKPTHAELWATIIFSPPLIWSFVERRASFRAILMTSIVVFVAIEALVFLRSGRNSNDMFDLVGNLSAELLFAVYVLLKFKKIKTPRR